MKKYKLIKEYPGSLSLGTIVSSENKTDLWKGTNYYDKYPEYWEEVVEKDYEIISFTQDSGITDLWLEFENGWCRSYNGKAITSPYTIEEILSNKLYNIASVKRLSDGEVFTIGDRAMTEGSRGGHSIRQFRIKQKCFGKNFSGNYTYDGIDRIWIDWEENCGGNWLESTIKLKQQIYLTLNGQDIFEGDIVWYVNKENFYHDYIKAYPEVKFNSDIRAYFLTEEEAKKYIIENKPALSIKEFWEITTMSGSNRVKSIVLKELAKKRLNLK